MAQRESSVLSWGADSRGTGARGGEARAEGVIVAYTLERTAGRRDGATLNFDCNPTQREVTYAHFHAERPEHSGCGRRGQSELSRWSTLRGDHQAWRRAPGGWNRPRRPGRTSNQSTGRGDRRGCSERHSYPRPRRTKS